MTALEDQQRMTVCSMALLHRLARACGGTLSIKMDEIPDELPFQFRIADGVGIFVALDKPPQKPSKIVPASGRALHLFTPNGG